MTELKYKNLIHRLLEVFDSNVNSMMAEYGYEYGPEFEIAICKTLKSILPQKYGICRGYVVSSDNQVAGDDIIIYDRENFSPLRFLEKEDFGNKEYIPVEAVYAYIECKYSLHINGDEQDQRSFLKACKQVVDVKSLPRQAYGSRLPYGPNPRPGWPEINNPIFGAVFALNIRKTKHGKVLSNGENINSAFDEAINNRRIEINKSVLPDLVVLGKDVVLLPLYKNKEEENAVWQFYSPFFIDNESILINQQVPGHAFVIGFLSLLTALNSIFLGRMPWQLILNEAITEGNRKFWKDTFGIDRDAMYWQVRRQSYKKRKYPNRQPLKPQKSYKKYLVE